MSRLQEVLATTMQDCFGPSALTTSEPKPQTAFLTNCWAPCGRALQTTPTQLASSEAGKRDNCTKKLSLYCKKWLVICLQTPRKIHLAATKLEMLPWQRTSWKKICFAWPTQTEILITITLRIFV